MDTLPTEILWQILEFLSPPDLTRLQLVSKRFFPFARDPKLWKALCYDDSSYVPALQPFHTLAPRSNTNPAGSGPWSTLDIARLVPGLLGPGSSITPPDNEAADHDAASSRALNPEESIRDKRARAIADWDPSYADEKVDWYSEYVARHAQPSVSWLETPVDPPRVNERREIRGIGYLKDRSGRGEEKIMGPLEDGSMCVWDLRSSQASGSGLEVEARGGILARSQKGLLFQSEGDPLSAKPGFVGVDECVGMDNVRNRVYIAVHNTLNEVDIETLQVVRQERYPWFISALSDATYPTPLTVGTTLSLHLHDPRQKNDALSSGFATATERVDRFSGYDQATLPSPPRNDFHRLFSGDAMPDYASLFQPNPLSILHLPSPTNPESISDAILVAGRFPSILHYDRRFFPRLTHTIHSGARLSSLSSLPYPPRLPMQQPGAVDNPDVSTSTLIAAGEYNGRGSLELYTFPPIPISSAFPLRSQQSFHSPTTPPPSPPPLSNYKNRQTTSSSKLLSCAPHGTRIVFSDADGSLKWVERDGRTLVRRWNINNFTHNKPVSKPTRRHDSSGRKIRHPRLSPGPNPQLPPTPPPFDFNTPDGNSTIFTLGSNQFGPVGTDVVRKIIPTDGNLENDRLLLWTGEKIAALRFKPEPEWSWDVEDREGRSGSGRDGREVVYEHMMRKALERQADEVRWMGRFGLGDR